MIYQEYISLSTKGENDIVDITKQVEQVVRKSRVRNGLANIFVIGSTAAVSTMEYEPGLVHDVAEALSRIAPKDIYYKHHERWGDDNGRSHVKATILGPSLTVPIEDGGLVLGTWQQIIFIELDTRPRNRRLLVTILGE
ncbi:MAG: secondary thiamine-phosphate synthase enzyme YjbQ [Candidatus Njordarchaeia archaeon]